MTKRWWERHRGRIEFEIEALAKFGAPFNLDQNLFERGVVVLKGHFPVESERIYLEIFYPDHYPYFRFQAHAPELNLRYHQQPFEKNLCLLPMSTRAWDYKDTAASVLFSQLPQILIANNLLTREEVLEHESHAGYQIETREPEPVERFMNFQPGAYIVIDSKWKPSGPNGALIIGFSSSDQYGVLSGAVLSVKDQNGKVLFTANSSLANLYPIHIKGRWQRTNKPIIINEPRGYIEQLSKINSAISMAIPQPARNIKTDVPKDRDLKIDVVASVYEDETSHRHMDGTLSWLFIARWLVSYKDKNLTKSGKKRNNIIPFFIKAERAGKDDMTSRVPELKGLTEKKIALFGLGCLGSQCAIEFAKAGIGELRLLDYDIISAGNAARWILGMSAVGKLKTDAVKEFIEKNYPYTKVSGFNARIGEIHRPDLVPQSISHYEIMEQMFNGIDVVVDATAEEGIQNFLSDMAREKGIPYVFISTTYGTRGGMVARFKHRATDGCCQCLRHLLNDKKIPVANEDDSATGQVIPAGCGEPTFTGNNFEALQISLAGVRITISTLMEGISGGYPSMPWDIEIINLRDEEGNLIPPQSKTFSIERHHACQNHK